MSWFESWFDSPYYHILYQHRNEKEAEHFLSKLISYLNPVKNATILDLGCGKGRHAVFLNNLGYEVTGIDLSEQSIKHCIQFENNTLKFFVHDMRQLFHENHFDYVFNLFTSFGYFDQEQENATAIKNACRSLKKGGKLVIDYLNTDFVKNHLITDEIVYVDGIDFKIDREFDDGFFIKNINFKDKGDNYSFSERVSGLTLEDFKRYLNSCGMKIESIFGNYDLHKFDETTSPRLIITAIKS